MRTVADLVGYGARRFTAARLVYGHGTTGAAQEAAFLVAHALRVAPDRLRPGARPSASRRAAALALIERRVAERTPAAYLVGEAWLADCRFYVDPQVIVPRSHLAELLRERMAPWIARPGAVRNALDLCTGSGCLAILLARSFPKARVDAADVSRPALAVARRNVRRHRLSRRIRVTASDLFSALRGGRYDLIVCNPPYVTAGGMRRLPREYRHEPRIALAGGRDGLDIVRRVVRAAAGHLKPGGLLVVEVGAGRRRVERALRAMHLTWPEMASGRPVLLVSRENLIAAGAGGRRQAAPRRAAGRPRASARE